MDGYAEELPCVRIGDMGLTMYAGEHLVDGDNAVSL